MSQHLREYIVGLAQFEHVLRGTPADAWDRSSPCEGWTAREVAGHAMGAAANVAAKLGRREPVDPFGDVAAIAGDDPLDSFRQIRNDVLEALDQPDSLQTSIRSSLGEMTIDDYLTSMTNDVFVHAWDVARATGGDEELDPWLLDIVATRMMTAELPRSSGRYSPAVPTDAGAPLQDRFIAFTGRQR